MPSHVPQWPGSSPLSYGCRSQSRRTEVLPTQPRRVPGRIGLRCPVGYLLHTMTSRAGLVFAALIGVSGCEQHDVEVEWPDAGRSLSRTERSELRQIADATFRDVRQ